MGKYLDKTGLEALWAKVKAADEAVNSALDARVDTLETKAAEGEEAIAQLESSNVNIKARLTDVEGEVDAIQGVLPSKADLVDGKVPSEQLPSFVDDVLEYEAKASFPASGESGKIYVDKSDNKTYRWSGSSYVEISASLALGETSSTAYRGDRGKTAYDHAESRNKSLSAGSVRGSEGEMNLIGSSDVTIGIPRIDYNAHGHITGASTSTVTLKKLEAATSTSPGYMSSTQAAKLNGIEASATADSALTVAEVEAVCV